MTKKKKETNKNPEKATLEDEKNAQIDQECANDVEQVLKKHGRALQPYLVFSEFGIVPRVRLVIIKENEESKEA